MLVQYSLPAAIVQRLRYTYPQHMQIMTYEIIPCQSMGPTNYGNAVKPTCENVFNHGEHQPPFGACRSGAAGELPRRIG